MVTTFATTAGITSTGQERYHFIDYITTFDHQTRRTFLNDQGVSIAVYPFAGLAVNEVHVHPMFPVAPGEIPPEGSRSFDGTARLTEVARTYPMDPSGNAYVVNPVSSP